MTQAKMDFFFDVGSPNAYLAYRALPLIPHGSELDVVMRPVLLGGVFKATGNRSPIEAFAGIPAKLTYEKLEVSRFVERHRLARFRFNPHFPVNTLAVMRAAIAARRIDVLSGFVEAAFAAMWEHGRNLADHAVLASTLQEADLPAERILELAQSPAVKQQLVDDTQTFVELGGFGVPTFLVGSEMFFGKDRLDQVVEACLSQPDEHAA